jgi:alkylation response protein AidB-like acyl-CoA dehydrogenase
MTPSTAPVAPRHFDVVGEVDAALGDPCDPANPAGFAALAAQDRADEFPTDAVAILDCLGVAGYYVPAGDGGRITDYLEGCWLLRAIARRSVTLAVAHGKTFLGAVTAWVGAAPEQRARMSHLVRSGVPVSWGLTEREHGSDLLAGDAAVVDGWLAGTKWLINNATRGGAVVAIARTSEAGGFRGFDLVLVEKAAVTQPDSGASYRHLPKELTHGIRGADISGIEFVAVPVDPTDVISEPGRGLENVIKALQLTRTLCCSLSLGAADRALHTAVAFAEGRKLSGRPLVELPQARRILADALADHLLNEATTIAVVRSIHTLTGELSVHAAAAKFVVPTRTEALLASLRSFLGAHAVLDPDEAVEPSLSRVERDHRIVSLFDGNTVVNLTTLIAQFSMLNRKGLPADSAAVVAVAPDADLSRLSPMSMSGSTLLRMLDDAVAQLNARDLPEACLRAADGLAAAARSILQDAAAAKPNPTETPDANFGLAERLAVAVAGAAAVHVYLAYADAIDSPLWRDGLWLRMALFRALAAVDLEAPTTGLTADHDDAVAALQALHGVGRGFSLLSDAELKGRS